MFTLRLLGEQGWLNLECSHSPEGAGTGQRRVPGAGRDVAAGMSSRESLKQGLVRRAEK